MEAYNQFLCGLFTKPSEPACQAETLDLCLFDLQYGGDLLQPTPEWRHNEYDVFQTGEGDFNKGKLMNAAAREALNEDSYDCLIFHDVDMIPEHDGNVYHCNDQVRHLSPAIDEMRYQ